MAVPIKSPRDIAAMRRAGSVLWWVLERAVAAAVAGVTTAELDRLIASDIAETGGEALAPEARFPGTAAICVNEEAVHAVPGPRILRAGDVVSIDVAIRAGGDPDRASDRGGAWCVDAARCLVVGEGDADRRRLVGAARGAVEAVIAAMRPGMRWSEAAEEAGRVAAAAGCRIVREYAGHGIGREMHEPPGCPYVLIAAPKGGHGPSAGQDFVLRPGMVLTVEPVLTLGGKAGEPGSPAVIGLDDGWTVVTADRSCAAHEERTVAVTRRGAEVLTTWE